MGCTGRLFPRLPPSVSVITRDEALAEMPHCFLRLRLRLRRRVLFSVSRGVSCRLHTQAMFELAVCCRPREATGVGWAGYLLYFRSDVGSDPESPHGKRGVCMGRRYGAGVYNQTNDRSQGSVTLAGLVGYCGYWSESLDLDCHTQLFTVKRNAKRHPASPLRDFES